MDNRFTHAPRNEDQNKAMQRVAQSANALLADIAELAPEGRGKSLAFTKLEEAAMWANKAICGTDKPG
jgi:hypothetical protein